MLDERFQLPEKACSARILPQKSRPGRVSLATMELSLQKEAEPQPKEKSEREERLVAALRANLKRRKAQARRRAEPGDSQTGKKDEGGGGQDQD